MKKNLLLVLVPALLLCLFGSAGAEVTAESYSVSPYIGGYSFLGNEHLSTKPVFGVRAGYNFTRHFGVEGVVDYTNTDGRIAFGHDVHVYNWHLDMLYHFMPDSRLVPYVVAGYGYQNRELPFDNDTSRWPFNYGAGAKYFLNDWLALRGDLRHLVMGYKSQTFHNLEYTFGADFIFGGKKAAAAAATPAAAPTPAPETPLGEVPAAEPTPGHFKYCVTLHGEYDIDRARIRPEDRREAATVGDFMKKYPSTTAVLEGHTDNVGGADYNMTLSKKRAQAVVKYLVEEYGIAPSRLEARGYGETRPIADNATNEGKQKNRRVEAVIDCAFDVKEVEPVERLCMSLVLDFPSDNAEVQPKYRDEIGKVADFMKKNPSTTAVIEGHTDNVGGYDYNMKLSQQRAQNVVDYLVENFGIERSRLSAKGYGYTRRIAYNDTEKGRALNRRINAVIDCVVKK